MKTLEITKLGRALLLVAAAVAGSVCVSYGAGPPESANKEALAKEIEKLSSYFTDSRNGQKYRAVKIGGKRWMARNLNYQTGNSWCYGDDNSNCEKYGRLYDWNTARTACPAGWHLPSQQEWAEMVAAAGGVDGAGKALKSADGWRDGGNGADGYGFSALPGGSRQFGGGFFISGYYGLWWAATEYSGGSAYFRNMSYNIDGAYEFYLDKSNGFSVRCRED